MRKGRGGGREEGMEKTYIPFNTSSFLSFKESVVVQSCLLALHMFGNLYGYA